MSLTREQILQADDIQTEKVNAPEWGGEFWVRGLSGIEKDEFEESIIELKEGKKVVTMKLMRAKLAAKTICDENKKRLFSDDDIELLGKKSSAVLSLVFDIAQRLSGLVKGDVERLAKN